MTTNKGVGFNSVRPWCGKFTRHMDEIDRGANLWFYKGFTYYLDERKCSTSFKNRLSITLREDLLELTLSFQFLLKFFVLLFF